jgi:hypothetical protein
MNRFTETRSARLTLLAVLLTGGMIAECAAADEDTRPARHVAPKTRDARAQATPASGQPQNRLGPMRYYGGPKSPMWRAPASE